MNIGNNNFRQLASLSHVKQIALLEASMLPLSVTEAEALICEKYCAEAMPTELSSGSDSYQNS